MSQAIYLKKELPGILRTSRTTVWKLEKSGKLKPSFYVNGSPRYSAADLAAATTNSKTKTPA